MNEIREIVLQDGSSVYVEMETVDVLPLARSVQGNLPPGAVAVGAADRVIDVMQALQSSLQTVFNAVHESVKNNAPDEWGVEVNIGFKGKLNPIPVIVSSESSVAIKVHAKWTKATTS